MGNARCPCIRLWNDTRTARRAGEDAPHHNKPVIARIGVYEGGLPDIVDNHYVRDPVHIRVDECAVEVLLEVIERSNSKPICGLTGTIGIVSCCNVVNLVFC